LEQPEPTGGAFRDGLRPLRAYRWRLGGGPLVEVPVTTMPIFRLPFHVSYLIYLAGFSPALARLYFSTALTLCRWTGVQPSLLLHPLDFLGADDGFEPLKFFPGMNMPANIKLAWLSDFIASYCRRFRVVPMGAHVDALEASSALPEIDPVFSKPVAAASPAAG
jgi:hypothetical protein